MRAEVDNEKYGKITYEESVWSGKKKVAFNGVALQPTGKNTFEHVTEFKRETVNVKGNSMIGVKLITADQTVTVISAPKWYEVMLAVLIFVFDCVWGNLPQAAAVLPLVGGAIGGAISGLMSIVCFMVMRKVNKWYFKVLIFLGFFGLNVLLCYLVALAFLAALT